MPYVFPTNINERHAKILLHRWQPRVHLEDFFNHKPETPYDAIVIYGVIEHIPYYQRFAAKVRELLKSGGRIYLDGSATHEKYDLGDFGHTYIYFSIVVCVYKM